MSTSKRLLMPLIVLVGLVMAAVAFAVPAGAAPYIGQTTISVTNQTPTAGSAFGVCGRGFAANEKVTIFLDQNRGRRGSTLGTASTDSSGAFACTSVTVNAIGAHKITATGASGRTATTKIRVVKNGVIVLGTSASSGTTVAGVSQSASAGAGQSASAGVGGLAFTGAAVIGIGSLGGLLLVGGAIMVIAGRRRRANV